MCQKGRCWAMWVRHPQRSKRPLLTSAWASGGARTGVSTMAPSLLMMQLQVRVWLLMRLASMPATLEVQGSVHTQHAHDRTALSRRRQHESARLRARLKQDLPAVGALQSLQRSWQKQKVYMSHLPTCRLQQTSHAAAPDRPNVVRAGMQPRTCLRRRVQAPSMSAGRHTICYDDGNLKTVSLSSERVDWTTLSSTCLPPTAPGQGAKPGPAALAADAAAAAAAGGYAPQPHQQPHDQQQQQQPCSSKAEPSGAGPELQQRITQSREPKSTVDVICNNLTGMYHVDSIHISLPDGTTMSPTEFERRAGKASAKKWKQSIRVHKVRRA